MNHDHRKPRFGRPAGKAPGNRGTRDRRGTWRDREERGDSPVILYGWHTVTAALANPQRQIRKLLLTENAARRLTEENIATKIAPEIVRPQTIDQLLGPDAVHQGLFAEADPLPSPDIDTLPQTGIVLVLDQITDPHNVGAIMRSAAAFAVKAIVTTARHSPEATGVLAKSASGALELVPMVTVQNLARALAALNERGFMTVGLDSEGGENLAKVELTQPLALVLGAEGKGLRQLTRETCSVMTRLDMPGDIKSLNVSNAAALSLYICASRLGLMP
ncbi:MAG: 23S rRNA (guanosine(2251)-2'-O)-methyltransferase RlmB [Rhizobiales bacterium 62-47]|nr:23S rRNA (guanosine(2251)-2'-O)-methyltransferase RlmB [Hyphomicrobiales bacterium]OJY08343.1 MAG: 23S rRNA (guanosine(2251)-2'-O)-methyltransferase RlmB [Rhizobiales bacterium 62-47]